jgi:hypothetical protein
MCDYSNGLFLRWGFEAAVVWLFFCPQGHQDSRIPAEKKQSVADNFL